MVSSTGHTIKTANWYQTTKIKGNFQQHELNAQLSWAWKMFYDLGLFLTQDTQTTVEQYCR